MLRRGLSIGPCALLVAGIAVLLLTSDGTHDGEDDDYFDLWEMSTLVAGGAYGDEYLMTVAAGD